MCFPYTDLTNKDISGNRNDLHKLDMKFNLLDVKIKLNQIFTMTFDSL